VDSNQKSETDLLQTSDFKPKILEKLKVLP